MWGKGRKEEKENSFFPWPTKDSTAKSLFPFCIVEGGVRRKRLRIWGGGGGGDKKKEKKTFFVVFCVRTTSVFARFQRTLYFFPLSPNLDFLICRMREKKIIFGKIPLFFLRGLTGKSPTDLLHPPPAANLRNSKSFFFSHFRRFFKGERRARARVSPCRRDVRTLGEWGGWAAPKVEVPGISLFCVPQLNYMQISSQKSISKKYLYISYGKFLCEKTTCGGS